MLYEIKEGSVSLAGQPVLSQIHFYIKGNEKMALVGANGSGKTTLLRLIAGQLSLDPDDKNPDSTIQASRPFSVGLLEQEVRMDPLFSPLDLFSLSGLDLADALRRFTQLGFTKEDATRPIAQFSGGQQKKILLLQKLLEKPELLLLDEPTNHLDLDAIAWLEEELIAYPHAILCVSHDRFFLDRIAQVSWELEDGHLSYYPGNYSFYRKEKQRRLQSQSKAYERQQAEIARLTSLIDKFKHKPKKAAFARSRRSILERMERIDRPKQDVRRMQVAPILPRRRANKWIFQAEELRIGYDQPLYQVNLRLRRGQRLGLLGTNGSGKSTLLKTIAGQMPPLSGKAILGDHVDLAYFDQLSSQMDGDESLEERFSRAYPALTRQELRERLSTYLFMGEDLKKPLHVLSGGEKARLTLALLLESGPNILLLDEPTNHLDIPSMEALESILKAYQGSILLVSHDRYFLQEICSSLLIFEDELRFYPFDYQHYSQHRALLKEGLDLAAIRSQEDQARIDSLRSIPRKSYLPHPQSHASMERDWDYRQAKESIARAEQRLEAAQRQLGSLEVQSEEAPLTCSLEDYMSGAYDAQLEEQAKEAEEAQRELTEDLTNWYDLWLQDHPEEA